MPTAQRSGLPGPLAKEGDVAVPPTLQTHFLTEDSGTQLVLLAEMDEPDASSFQLLY